MRKFTSMLCLILSLLLAVTGASAVGKSDPLGRPESKKATSLVVGNTTRVSGNFFTSQFGNNTSDIDVRNMLHGYSPVVWVNQLDYIQDPVVVKSLVKSKSGKDTVYTVTLNEGLTYNDGRTQITAADYVFSYLLLASKEFASIGADTAVWSHIAGYEDYASGKTNTLKGIRLKNEYTFQVIVKSDCEPYFYELQYLYVFPYPISVIAPGCTVADSSKGAKIVNIDSKKKDALFTSDLIAKTILGGKGYLSNPRLTAGPYKLVSYDTKNGIVKFEKNPYYAGNYEGVYPVIDRVTLTPVLPENMIEQLQTGKVQLLNKCVDKTVIDQGLETLTEGFKSRDYDRLGYGFLFLACDKGPQQFVKVRQALNYAFDGKAFAEFAVGSYGSYCKGYYGQGQWMTKAANGWRPDGLDESVAAAWDQVSLSALEDYDVDLDKAVSLLEEDGWVLNENGDPFDAANDSVRCKRIDDEKLMRLSFRFAQCEGNPSAEKAAEMLAENLPKIGAEFLPEIVPFTTLLADRSRNGEDRVYDMNFMATNFASAYDFYEAKSEQGGVLHTSGIVDETLMDLAKKMHDTAPHALAEYEADWFEYQKRFNEILPTIPLYTNTYYDFHVDSLKNYHIESESGWPQAILYAYMAN